MQTVSWNQAITQYNAVQKQNIVAHQMHDCESCIFPLLIKMMDYMEGRIWSNGIFPLGCCGHRFCDHSSFPFHVFK
jgi:hypothetical protein